MNIPKTIETALATVLRDYGVGAETIIRCWHGLDTDFRWSSETDREFPAIDIRCAPVKTSEENRVTQIASVNFMILSNMADDRDHADVCSIELATQEALDNLYGEFINGGTGAAFVAFQAAIVAECPDIPQIADIVFGEPTPPYNDESLNAVGINMLIHFARTDFL